MRLRILAALALLCLSAGLTFGQGLSLTNAPNPSTQGQAVTFTANPVPSAQSVAFYDGGSSSGTLIGSGKNSTGSPAPVSIQVSTLSVGQHSIIACVTAAGLPAPSCSNTVTQTVNQSQPFTLTTSPNPSTFGQAVGLTAGPAPSGTTVTFLDGGSSSGTMIGSSSTGGGTTASFSVSTLSVGTHQLIACYPIDFPVLSCSNTVNQVVNQSNVQTSLSLTSSQNPATPCQSVTFTATVTANSSTTSGSPTGTVTFFDGTTQLGQPVTLSGGSASITVTSLSLGTHRIQAQYTPVSPYLSSSGLLTEVVSSGSTITVNSAPNPSNSGQTVTITASVAAAACPGQPPPSILPTGTVFFFDGPTTNPGNLIGQANLSNGTATFSTSTLAVGSHSLDAQYGGDTNYGNSTSNAVTQVVNTVNKTNTTTTLTTSANPISTTQSLTLTATVTPAGTGTPTGQVQFRDGATVVGTATLSGGTASTTLPNLPAGTHSLTAVYLGDNNFNTSTSNTVNEIVNPPGLTNTTTTLSASPNPAQSGQTVTLTASVTPSSATGQVQFKDGGSVIGGTTVSGGIATFQTSTLAAGTHSLTASYLGDTNDNPSTSNAVTLVVNTVKQNTTTNLTATPNPVTTGQPLTLTASVSPSGATGTVQFTDGSIALGTVTLSNGVAAITTSSLSLGTHNLVASYSGDANFNPSTGTATVNVTQPTNQPTSISLSVAPLSANPGQAVIMSAVVTPATATGTVNFTDNGSILANVALSNGSAGFQTTSLAVGSHTIVASYGGSATLNPSSSNAVTVVINGPTAQTTQTTLSASPITSTFGQTVVFNASVSPVTGSGTPTGTISFNEGSNTLGTVTLSGGSAAFSTSTLSVGSHSLVAAYSGDSTFGISSSLPVVVQVNKATTTTLLSATPTSANPGQGVALTAKVTPATATGTITFMDGTSAIGAPVPVVAGSASTTTSSLANGSHTLTAVYSGDSNFLTSTSPPVNVSVGVLTATTTTLVVTPASPNLGQAVTMTATVSGSGATGTVMFLDGTATLGTQPLGNGTATFTTSTLAAGTHSLSAVYSGDTRFAGSTSNTVTETLPKATSSTVLTASPNPATSGQAVTLRAVVTPSSATGTVTFLDGSATLGTGTLTIGVATFTTSTLSVGSHSLTASYAGDVNNGPSTSAAVTEVVTSPTPGPSNILPATLPNAIVGVPYSQTFTVTGGTAPLTWSLLSGSVPGLTLSPGGVLSGTPTTAATTTLGIRVTDSNGLFTATGPSLTVLALPAVSITAPQPATLQDQPAPQVTVPGFPDALTATFALSFTPDASVKGLPTQYTNPDLLFANGTTTSSSVSVPANSTAAISVDKVQLGSVAGVVTVRLASLTDQRTGQTLPLPSTVPSTTITVKPGAPVITSVKITGVTSSSFQVVVDATSTTRDLTSASLTFTAASGTQLNGSPQTVSLTSAAASWFVPTGNTSLAKGNGGAFSVTMTFPYSGDTTALSTVSVTLTNGVGTSPAVSGGR